MIAAKSPKKRYAPRLDPKLKFIVKAQISLDGFQKLIYNEDQTVMWQAPIDGPNDPLLRLMKDSKKEFFWATLKNTIIHIDRRAPWQDW